MTEDNKMNYENAVDQGETVGPTETGPSLDAWKNEPEVEPTEENINWDTFNELPVKERQRLLGVPVTGTWGAASKAAYKEARNE